MPMILPIQGSDEVVGYTYPAASATSPLFTFPAYSILWITFCIEGYGGSAIASLRFNNDSTAGNYASQWSQFSTAAPSAPTNTLGTFAGIKLGQNAVGNQRNGWLEVKNNSTTQHICNGQSQTAAAATAAAVISFGGGRYVTSGATVITSLQMITDTGATISAGSTLNVYGLTA